MAKTPDIVAAKPIDRTAGLVVSGGVHFDSSKRLNQEIWTDGPPPVVDPPQDEDLRGTSRGRMVIFGYLSRQKLLGRCSCGNYEMRDAKKWRKGLRDGKDDLGCQYCVETNHQKNKDHFRRTGKSRPTTKETS